MKRYLITGASRGIGRAIAQSLATPHVHLLLHGRDPAALGETARMIEGKAADVVLLQHDLATPSGVDGLIRQVGQGPIDLLVNNAGIAVVKPFAEVTRTEWEQTLAVNVTAPFLLLQHFAPTMSPGASVVNILSVAATTAFPNWSAYCASKFALHGLTAAIREELRPRRVRVLNIYPAATATEIWSQTGGTWPREKMMTADNVAAAVRFALQQPDEVAVENITLGNVVGAL